MKYSVLVTVYNKEKYVEKCLLSIINQSYNNIELIVLNDGSKDNSNKIIEKLRKKYNFQYFNLSNRGVSASRNFLISKVKTDYFMFVDADDYIEQDLLKKLNIYLKKNPDIEIVSFNAKKISDNYTFIKKITKPLIQNESGETTLLKFIQEKSLFTVPWGFLYKTDYIKINNFLYPEGEILEDFYLTPLIILKAKVIGSIDYLGYCYVQSKNSIIRKKNYKNNIKIMDAYLKHYDNLIKIIQKSSYSDDTKSEYIFNISNTILWWFTHLKFKDFNKYFKEINARNIFEICNQKENKYKNFINFSFWKFKSTLKNNKTFMNLYYKYKKMINKTNL